MENFKNKVSEGEIVLTPTKWLDELSTLLYSYGYESPKGPHEILTKICVSSALECGYEQGLTPNEYIEENLLENC